MRRKVRRSRRRMGRRRQRVHHFKRTTTAVINVPAVGAVPYSQALHFELDFLQNYNEFAALYDTYRINKVLVKFVPRTTDNALASGERGNFYSCIDYNDDSAFVASSAISTILERDNVRKTRTTQIHSRCFRPAVAAAAYRSGATNGYMPKWKQWIDMSNPDVQHFGFKYVVDNRDDLVMAYDLYITYYMSFKNVR